MPTQLHVENLRFSLSSDELKTLFAPFGAVLKARVMSHLKTGCSTATGLVEMGSDEEGNAAIAALDGRMWSGHLLVVRAASARQQQGTDRSRMFESMNVPDEYQADDGAAPDEGKFNPQRLKGN